MENSKTTRARPASPPVIRIAQPADVPFLVDLQRRFYRHLGFLPRSAVEEYTQDGHATIVEENGDPAGFVISRKRSNSARWCRPIVQACVAMDAQRRHLGLALMASTAENAKKERLEGLQLWIADDLEEVNFFLAADFIPICTRDAANTRRRRLILMRHNLNPFVRSDFTTPPRVAGWIPRKLRDIDVQRFTDELQGVRRGESQRLRDAGRVTQRT